MEGLECEPYEHLGGVLDASSSDMCIYDSHPKKSSKKQSRSYQL